MDDDALIRRKLIETAAKKKTIFYSELGDLIGLNVTRFGERNCLSKMLGRISTAEHAEGRPMLSAVAVRKPGRRPGEGFFQLARRLGRYTGGDFGEEHFFETELKRVHEFWKECTANPGDRPLAFPHDWEKD